MKRVGLFLTSLIVSIFLLIGCSTGGMVAGSGQGTLVTNSQAENKQQDTNSGGTTTITASEIIDKYIPKPFNPVVLSDGLEFSGKWAGNVMPSLTQEMEKKNWTLFDGQGAKKFYEKDINDSTAETPAFFAS